MGKILPEDIGGPENVGKPKAIGSDGGMKSPTRSFDTYMQEGTGQTASKSGGVSPMDLPAGSTMQPGTVNMESIGSQMNATSGVLGDIQQQLNTKNLKLKQSQKYLLRNKLTEANTQLRSAAAKTGIDVGEPPSMMTRQSPLGKFLALVNDGQNQMNGAVAQLKAIKADGKSINPGDMMLIQVKLAKAQQELEYTSVLLSKAVDDIKTLFQVQI